MSFDVKELSIYPERPGVYLMKDPSGLVLYIGKANNLKARVKQYFSVSGDSRAMIPFLICQIASIDTIITPNEKEALLLENTLIKKHKPKYNALLKDDKTYLSLYINTQDQWPKIELLRTKGKPHGKGLYFGPYTSALAAREILDLLQKLFPLRQCSDSEFKRRVRPCLLYDMKKCIAPCVQKCTAKEYDLFVKGAISFLKGQDKSIIKDLKVAMEEASHALEYEKAHAILQTIRQIEHVLDSKKVVINPFAIDLDALSLYREAADVMLTKVIFRDGKLIDLEKFFFADCLQEDPEILSSFIWQHYQNAHLIPSEILVPSSLGEDEKNLRDLFYETFHKKPSIITPQKGDKKELLDLAYENAKNAFIQEKGLNGSFDEILLNLQETFQLSRYPQNIECFDTSNISGSDLVACKVRFIKGVKDKSGKRLFTIQGINKSDDYGALSQALSRRIERGVEENDLPDLIIVDGGKGQLNVALEVLKEHNIISIDVISLAKEDARHDKGITLEKVFIPNNKEAIFLNYRSPLLFFLQKIRDAAHDAAITFHKNKRQKRVIASSLDTLKGIGPIKKKALLKHFGSVTKIKEASQEQLESLKVLNKKDIETILKKLF